MNVFFKSSLFFVFLCNINVSLADEFSAYKSGFDSYKSQIDKNFSSYKKELQDAFSVYKNKTAKVWGKNNTKVDDKNKWVSYQGDLNHRSVVDFEKGTVEVEIAIPIDKPVTDEFIQNELKKTLLKTIEQGADDRSIIELAKEPLAKPEGTSVLSGLIANKDKKVLTKTQQPNFIAELSTTAKKKIIIGDDGKSRLIYVVKLNMVPGHIKKRAEKYRAQVNKNAQKQKIPAALILAIMETESMFNPTARSHTPAFGLMQLVPTTGALDAYRHLYKKDRIVKDTYLYNPTNNIELGSAYLNKLYYGYFKEIKNETSKQWATIAAYNTGMGNVYAAFVGRYSKSKYGSRKEWKRQAFFEINKRSSEEVYWFLHRNLSREEGRQYVKKVRTKMAKYT